MTSPAEFPSDIPATRSSDDQNRAPPRDWPLLLTSIAFQLILGVLLGHAYDITIFMATGYQVAMGHSPYVAEDLSRVFDNPAFRSITSAGYPPPWPLMLGAIYRLVYATVPSFLAYNAAIKVPLILANVGLAYLGRTCLRRLGANEVLARRAWAFLLLNPFLVLVTAAWGQIDSIVALLSLAALLWLDSGKPKSSAFLLALAISFKPTAFPLVLVPFFYLGTQRLAPILSFYAVLILSLAVFCVAPFLIFGWDASPIQHGWNAHFAVGGGLSPMAILELIQNSYVLSGNWWLLGLTWIPALGLASLALRPGIHGFKDLLKKSTGMILVFLLTRAWLSEQNIVLVLPLVLILTLTGDLSQRALHALWILPLIFAVFNTAIPQLLFPSMPHIMDAVLKWMDQFRTARLITKVVLVVPWQVLGWHIVLRCLGRAPSPASLPT